MGGKELKTSAMALEQAARSLDAAAAKLDAGKGASSTVEAPGGSPAAKSAEKLAATGLLSRAAFAAFGMYEAAANVPQTPEEWKKRGEANDKLQAGVDKFMRDHLPEWFFPKKTLLERLEEPTQEGVGGRGRLQSEQLAKGNPHGELIAPKTQKLDVQTEVKGKVEGEAMLTVKMDPSPLFLAKIEGSLRSIPLSGKLAGKSMSGDTGLGNIGAGNHFAPTLSGF